MLNLTVYPSWQHRRRVSPCAEPRTPRRGLNMRVLLVALLTLASVQEREKRSAQSAKLKKWAVELEALAEHLEAETRENGWNVRYGYVDRVPDPPLTVLVTIGGAEFARFVRDEVSIIGVFEDSGLQRFSNRHDAFDAAVKRRMARQKLRR